MSKLTEMPHEHKFKVRSMTLPKGSPMSDFEIMLGIKTGQLQTAVKCKGECEICGMQVSGVYDPATNTFLVSPES